MRRIEAIEHGGAEALLRTSQRKWLEDTETAITTSLNLLSSVGRDVSLLNDVANILRGILAGTFPTDAKREQMITVLRQSVDEYLKDETLTENERNIISSALAESHDFLQDLPAMERDQLLRWAVPTDRVNLVEQWVERGRLVDEFTAGSSEAKVWLLDNPDVRLWALDNKLLTDDGSDWNEPVLRINARWRVQDEEYDALPVEGDDRKNYLARNEDYRKDRRRRDAYGDGFSEDQIENYVAYYELSTKGYRQERMLIDNPEFGKAMHEIAGIDLPDPKKIPAVGWDETYEKWQADFEKLEGLSDHESEYYIENVNQRAAARYNMRYDARGNPTELGKAEKRLDAYAFFVPEDLIPTFVEWYTSLGLKRPDDWKYDYWFEDDWFLMEHPRFYQTMLDLKIWLEPTDFSKVPTREVFALYQKYQDQDEGKGRLIFRHNNPSLEKWLVDVKGYTPVGDRWQTKEPVKEPTTEPPFDPALANRKYWLDRAYHYKDLLKSLGIREDITAEELTDYQAEQIKKAIEALHG